MKKAYRPRRNFKGLRARRKQAAGLFAAGRLKQAEISRRLGVSRTSVHRWYAAWRREGASGLYGAGRAGRKPRLEKGELRLLDRALREGAAVWGFATDLWTLPRVARVIEEISGVSYHPGHVWRVLRSLNWTRQRPARRAKERNEKEIRRWVAEDWPRVNKTLASSGPGSYSKTRVESPTDRRSEPLGRPKAKPRS
jgi:transposase